MSEFDNVPAFLWLALPVVLAYVADLAMGDPSWLPHPVVAFGKSIAFAEKRLNKGRHRLLKGLIVAVGLIVATYVLFFLMEAWCRGYGNGLHMAFVAFFVFTALANRTLVHEGKMVFDRLEHEGLEAGRQQLSRIVGRDTSGLSAQQIRTAVLETMAENLSDGVVAPLFWFAIGGVPAAMAYKMVNTLDSMVGYKNERYLLFGKAAARIDDVANLVPARLTALLMVCVSCSWRGLVFIFMYGRRHSSPNSGYPEAALAGILDVRFGGPNIYHGKLVDKPFIGQLAREITHSDYRKTALVNHLVCLAMVVLVVVAVACS